MALTQIEEENERYYRWVMMDSPAVLKKRAQDAAEAEEKQKQAEASERQDRARMKGLEKIRSDRLTREQYEGLTPDERTKFDSLHGKIPTMQRLADEAKRQIDARFEKIEAEWQFNELVSWRKGLSVDPRTAGRAEREKIYELASLSDQRKKARLENRRRRELEAEAQPDAARRILSCLTQEEVEIFKRLIDEEPSSLERVQQFIEERTQVNEIEGIDSPRELYHRAAERMARPRKEQQIPKTEDIAQVESSRTLYAMHQRDVAAKSKHSGKNA